uniref:Uncharacterized protein n=1 Tax=Taenioma perpusillum TaxID=210852 RepID=A0A1Z1MRU4_9FLOR|nr:hypothetical protein [Taenioma perpusillum]ARW68485.1 hypothetical protein [Taenioma perpusillum]
MNNLPLSIDYNYILNNFLGSWIVQKSIFIFQTRNIYKYEKKITIKEKNNLDGIYTLKFYRLTNKETYFSSYISSNRKYVNKINILKKNKNIYTINYINNNIIKISHKSNNNTIYNEYIYNINSSFNIIIGILKINNIYLSTSFTSYIKTNL